MAFLSPLELSRLGLPRPELLSILTRHMDEFERRTGQKTYVGDNGGVRSRATQTRIYRDSLAQGFRAAPPGGSHHEFGAAYDLIIVGTGKDAAADKNAPLYKTLADIGEELGVDAGFYFNRGKPDPYHFQLREDLGTAATRWETLTRERLRRGALGVAVVGLVLLAALHASRSS